MAASLNARTDGAQVHTLWLEPQPIGSGLLEVLPFDLAVLPPVLRNFTGDISERMQTPADFVGVTAMVAAGSLIGTKVGIRPQSWTDWHEVPNLWGMIIGRPGVMKSPAMKAAMRPLLAIEADARQKFECAKSAWDAGAAEREVRASACKAIMKDRFRDDPTANVSDLTLSPGEEPSLRRYIANDVMYQGLGILLQQNSNGLLIHRDELVALLKSLDGETNAEARGFYLQGWNGGDGYTFDRVGRGMNQHIPSVTLSLIGSTQPGKIKEYISAVLREGAGDDGLIQRFGMTTFPDMPVDWREHDRPPNARAMADVLRAFGQLDELSIDAIGAIVDEGDEKRPYLRLDPDGRSEFQAWHSAHEKRLRSGELHPAVESHLAKYRKLVPALALIHHLVSGGIGSVGVESVLSALAWSDYLESHALRLYGAATSAASEGARTIAKHIRKGDLGATFDPRSVQRKGWSGLSEAKAVSEALDVLEEHHWIALREEPTSSRGGRPTVTCIVNPKALP